MKFRTIFLLFLLFAGTQVVSCGSKNPESTAITVEDAEKQLAKQEKKRVKAANREKKRAHKHYWSLQTKDARKSIKKNYRRQKKAARKRKNAGGEGNPLNH